MNPNNSSRYVKDKSSEEDRNYYDKYSETGESEWSRGSTVPFDSDNVLSERHYNLGTFEDRRASQFSREIPRGNNYGKGPKGYKRSDDRILEDVSDALYRCYEVDATEIEVSVEAGVVTLKGFVDSRISKKAAEMTIESIPGVRDVNNQLVIARHRAGLVRNETGLN